MKPERIQRERRRGWRKPANTVCVTRGTIWGNPFVVCPELETGEEIGHGHFAVPNAEEAVETFREFLALDAGLIVKARKSLAGKNLACWCAIGEPCHADVLLEVANNDA